MSIYQSLKDRKADIFSTIRAILIAAGSFLVGHAIWGEKIDQPLIETGIGVAMSLFGFVWGIFDHSNTLESSQSAIRGLIQFIGGFVVAHGYITNENLTQILGASLSIITLVYSNLDKVKNQQIIDGKIQNNQLQTPSGENKKIPSPPSDNSPITNKQ